VVPSITLLELYIEFLGRRHTFKEAFKKFGVLNRENYQNDRDYDVAVARRAATIEMLPPINIDGKKRGEIRKNWILRFQYNDEQKWLAVLDYAINETSVELQHALKNQFATLLRAEESKRNFAIEDLEIARDTLIAAYATETSHALAFLEEQAKIARELQIETYSASAPKLEARTFDHISEAVSSTREVISEVTSDEPFFLRGYRSIDKEIALIRSREDIEPFVDGLNEIDRKIDALRGDKSVERAENLFALTPAATGNGFAAVSVEVEATKFQYESKRGLLLVLALIGGGLVGSIFVLILNAIRLRKEREETTS